MIRVPSGAAQRGAEAEASAPEFYLIKDKRRDII